jgi:hypothetical protein
VNVARASRSLQAGRLRSSNKVASHKVCFTSHKSSAADTNLVSPIKTCYGEAEERYWGPPWLADARRKAPSSALVQ